ncbi:MAG: hypothetical protein NVS3B2_04180 [Ramlibacter sp.]
MGDFVAGTDFTFVAGLAADLAWGGAALGLAVAGLACGLITFFATGFAAGFTSFPDF